MRRGGGILYFFPMFPMFDPMSELTGASSQGDDDDATGDATATANPRRGQSGGYAQEVHSITIHGRQRTFYIDMKESSHGRFFKVSEKSRGGQKTTIMFDAEDLDKFIEALSEMKGHL